MLVFFGISLEKQFSVKRQVCKYESIQFITFFSLQTTRRADLNFFWLKEQFTTTYLIQNLIYSPSVSKLHLLVESEREYVAKDCFLHNKVP